MGEQQLYQKFAQYYDLIYQWKDYAGEVEFIKKVVERHKDSNVNHLLEVACGTGNHTQELVKSYNVTAVDLNSNMLDIARDKLPDVEFILQDMKQLNLGRKFDIIVCLFSSINYHADIGSLERTLKLFYSHLNPSGLLIFDLGISLDNWDEGRISLDTVVEDDLQIARICQSRLKSGVFNADFVFLVKKNGKVDFDIDQHQIGVFSTKKVKGLLEDCGFSSWIYDGFFDLPWDKESGEGPVFVCVKKSGED
jgi:SAM-dependent methyltransferase